MLGRRAFLLFASLLAPAARLRAAIQPPAPAPAISVDEFLRLSQKLTARPRLDAQIAATYLNALLADAANGPLLVRLVHDSGPPPTPAHAALERTIIECWYTGIYAAAGERRVATHTGALMWSALGSRAPGACVPGAFGEWSRPPRSTD